MADVNMNSDASEPFLSDFSDLDSAYNPNSSNGESSDEDKGESSEKTPKNELLNTKNEDNDEPEGKSHQNSRKRVRNLENHARYKRKMAREKGEYVTEKGNRKNAKKLVVGPCSCKMKCHMKISNERKLSIFKNYYSLNWSMKNAFIQGQIKVEDKKRTYTNNPTSRRSKTRVYTLPDENGCDQVVCKNFFKDTVSITDGKISLALARKQEHGTPRQDARGKHPPHNKTNIEDEQYLCGFIELFPAYESHYSRRDNIKRKYLSPTLNMSIMYREYEKKCTEDLRTPLSLFMFRKIFNTKFNLHFHAPHTCQKCDSLNTEIKSSDSSEERKQDAKVELELHQRKAEAVKENKKQNIIKAKESQQKISVLVFDLQKTLPTPELSTGVVYYKRQLWTYNLGIHDEVTETGHMYVWPENVASRGAQEIASCLIKHLETHLPDPTEYLILYSDACGGQNRNIKVALMLSNYLQKCKSSLKVIEQRFFVSGHSFNTCDQDFGLIEKERKHHDRIFDPNDWVSIIQSAKKRNPKFQVKRMNSLELFSSKSLENKITNRKVITTGEKVEWLKIQQIRYLKNEPKKIYLKYTAQDLGLFHEVDLSKKTKGRPSSSTVMHNLDVLFSNGRAITKEKKKDLMDLLKFIPPEFHSFYSELKDSSEALDEGLEEAVIHEN